ncbi:MAG: hypothetical protein V4525_10900 [Pseudomonadota bacterium]
MPPSSEDHSQTDEQSKQNRTDFILNSRRIKVGVSLAYVGIGTIIFFYFVRNGSLSYYIEQYGPAVFGFSFILAGFYLVNDELNKRRLLRKERFVDVDARLRSESDAIPYIHLIEKIGALEESSKANIQEIIAQFKSEQNQIVIRDLDSFTQYFDSIRKVLEQKAAIADEKASILLDKGANYSRLGITFFIISIIGWQILTHFSGFHIQHIYGIVSCSLLFIFIEFLSAWYLKQYRQFIDTSTYLIKVKSIFDKYMLVYLATKEATSLGHDAKKSSLHLIEMLRADIKWPESYLTKNADLSFAKEALETINLFAKNMKSEAMHVSKKSSRVKDEVDT